MHGVQSPSYIFLKERSGFADQEVESPISTSRQRDTFRTNGQRHDLWTREVIRNSIDGTIRTSGGYNHGRGPQLARYISTVPLKRQSHEAHLYPKAAL